MTTTCRVRSYFAWSGRKRWKRPKRNTSLLTTCKRNAFSAVQESLSLLQATKGAVNGLEVLQIQKDAVKGYPSLQLKLAVRGSNLAFPVVAAVTKLSSGNPMGAFINKLKAAVADPVAGAVIVRPGPMKLGAGRKHAWSTISFRIAARSGRSNLLKIAPPSNSWNVIAQCLDLADQKNLLLGKHSVTPEECRQLRGKMWSSDRSVAVRKSPLRLAPGRCCRAFRHRAGDCRRRRADYHRGPGGCLNGGKQQTASGFFSYRGE